MKTKKESQNDQILQWLQTRGTINRKTAENIFGCARLESRICDLKKRGHDIDKYKTKNERTGKWYTHYYLIK